VCYHGAVPDDASAPVVPATSNRWVRVSASLFAVFWGYLFFGLIDLLVPLQDESFHEVLLLETGWGLVFVFLVAAPLITAAVRPHAALSVALQQLVVVSGAVTVAALMSASPRHLLITIGLLPTVLVIARGDAQSVLKLSRQWSWVPGALVVAAAIPWFIYAATAASAHRDESPPMDLTWEFNHWPIQAALPIAVVLIAAFAATYPPGWVVPTWCAGVCAAWLAVVSWFEPDLAASLGRAWALTALAWAIAFVATVHMTAHSRTRRNTIAGHNQGGASTVD
jgi:hypothetical protein